MKITATVGHTTLFSGGKGGMKITVALEHAALSSSGKGIESYRVRKHPRSSDGGMVELALRPHSGYCSGSVILVTVDAVTAYNLGTALKECAEVFLNRREEELLES